MICLTGDLHHAGLGAGNQAYSELTEVQVARRYLELLEPHGIKVTFFVSGLAFRDEWDELRHVCEHPLVELGGHNWNCFQPELLHRVFNKVCRSYNGPAWWERRDVRKTVQIIGERTGQRIRFWRNHMYMHGPHTGKVLAAEGFRICSDGVKKDAAWAVHSRGQFYNFPINVIPDHEHIFHAERTPEYVDTWVRRYGWSDDYGPDSYDVDAWTDIALQNIAENEARGAISNILIHPLVLHIADGFRSFRRILDVLKGCETVHMSRVYEEALAARKAGRELLPV